MTRSCELMKQAVTDVKLAAAGFVGLALAPHIGDPVAARRIGIHGVGRAGRMMPAQTMADRQIPVAAAVLPIRWLLDVARFLVIESMIPMPRDLLGASPDEACLRHTNLE